MAYANIQKVSIVCAVRDIKYKWKHYYSIYTMKEATPFFLIFNLFALEVMEDILLDNQCLNFFTEKELMLIVISAVRSTGTHKDRETIVILDELTNNPYSK